MVSLAGEIGSHKLRIAEHIVDIVLANLILYADQREVEVIVVIVIISLILVVIIAWFHDGLATVVIVITGVGRGNETVALVKGKDNEVALALVLDHRIVEVGSLQLAAERCRSDLGHVDLALLHTFQLVVVEHTLLLCEGRIPIDIGMSRCVDSLLRRHDERLTVVHHLLDQHLVAPLLSLCTVDDGGCPRERGVVGRQFDHLYAHGLGPAHRLIGSCQLRSLRTVAHIKLADAVVHRIIQGDGCGDAVRHPVNHRDVILIGRKACTIASFRQQSVVGGADAA